MFDDQAEFEIRCEWGLLGVKRLAPISDAIVIVDVLSFSTCVDIAVGNGAMVHPHLWLESSAREYAESIQAVLASSRKEDTGYSLSPASLQHIPAGTRLVLPSPNGSALSMTTGATPTIAGCLRNAAAAAQVLPEFGRRISIIPAGERWPDGSLRPALEDLAGAGSIIHHLSGSKSPEAKAAEAVFIHCQGQLLPYLNQCSSGKELIERGFAGDIELAAALNESGSVPLLRDGAYFG